MATASPRARGPCSTATSSRGRSSSSPRSTSPSTRGSATATCVRSRSRSSLRSSRCRSGSAWPTPTGLRSCSSTRSPARAGSRPSTTARCELPTGMDLPPHLKGDFPDFVRAMFGRQVERHDMSTVFTEYAWEASTCDPCPGPPLTAQEMRQLGRVLDRRRRSGRHLRDPAPRPLRRVALPRGPGVPGDRRPHAVPGPLRAAPSVERHQRLPRGPSLSRRARRAARAEARALADLTGWRLGDIRSKMAVNAEWVAPSDGYRWWDGLWRR